MLRNKTQIAKICTTSRLKIDKVVKENNINFYCKNFYNEKQFNKIAELLNIEYLTFESKINNK